MALPRGRFDQSELGILDAVGLRRHGVSVGSETLGSSSRVRRAAPRFQMQPEGPVGRQLCPHKDGRLAVLPHHARGAAVLDDDLLDEARDGWERLGEAGRGSGGRGEARRGEGRRGEARWRVQQGGECGRVLWARGGEGRGTTTCSTCALSRSSPPGGWSNAAKGVTFGRCGSEATASLRDLRRAAAPPECEGRPQAFGCSLKSPRSPWWLAVAPPRRPLPSTLLRRVTSTWLGYGG